MKNGFVTEGAAAIAHAVMIGSNEGDKVIIAASTPEKLSKAFSDLVGGKLDHGNVSRVAICDADLVGLLQVRAANDGEKEKAK